MAERVWLFVYGTLMRGDCRHAVLADQTFVGEGRTSPHYALLDLGNYPGLIEAADGLAVEGEVWSVSPERLRALDEVEGVDEKLYERRRVELQAPYSDREILAYFYTGPRESDTRCGPRWDGRTRGTVIATPPSRADDSTAT